MVFLLISYCKNTAQYGKDVLGVVRLQEARRHKAEAERLRRLAEDEEDSQERKHLVLQARAKTRAYSDIKSARWTLLRKDASLTGNARDALEDILEKHRDIAICHSMKEELSELFRIRGGGGKGYALQEWKRWFDSAEARYPPLPASRDARGSASKGLPTTRGTASAPASSRDSTTG